MVTLALLTRAPFLGHPAPDYDEQLYSLIGKAMLDGAVPYVDLWDRKPLGLFLIFAGAHGAFGPSPLAYQGVAVAACLAGGWLCFRLGTRIGPVRNAAFAAALYPVLMAIYGSHAGQSEIFLMVPTLAMALLVVSAREAASDAVAWRRMLAAMACGGLALQVKYTVLPSCLWFGLVALADLRRRGWSWPRTAGAAATFGALGVGPTALVAAWYAVHGHWREFLFANFLSIGRRAPMPLRYTLAKQLVYLAPLAMLAAMGVIHARILGRRTGPGWALMAGWLTAATLGLFMGTTIYPYYYAALVPAVILVAMPLFDLRERTGSLLLAGVLAWLMLSYNPPKLFGDAARERGALAEMAAAVRSQAGRPPTLYVYDGPVALYGLAGAALPTRLIYPDHLNNALEARALPLDPALEVRRILGAKPGAIVTSPVPVTMRNEATAALVRAELAAHYRLAGRYRFSDRPIEVWLRRPAASTHRTALANRQSLPAMKPGNVLGVVANSTGKSGIGVS